MTEMRMEERNMRIITDEYREMLNKSEIYQYFMNLPKPDFTELDKECSEFKAWITEEHKKDREIMLEALKANDRK